MSAASTRTWREGGCHCGGVRFAAELGSRLTVQDCNCSMCIKVGFLHVDVPEDRFRLLVGAERLTSYSFNTGVAHHLFCDTCGVKAFYRPRSNPDGWSVNARCLDAYPALDLSIEPFDGAHWEAHGPSLAQLSRA